MSKSLSDLKFALVVATYILPAKDFYILSSFSFKRADIYLIKKKWGKNHFFLSSFLSLSPSQPLAFHISSEILSPSSGAVLPLATELMG